MNAALAIAIAVRRRREAQGLTQAELARLMHWHAPAVSRLEAGTSLPTVNTIVRVAEALGCSPSDLMPDGGEEDGG